MTKMTSKRDTRGCVCNLSAFKDYNDNASYIQDQSDCLLLWVHMIDNLGYLFGRNSLWIFCFIKMHWLCPCSPSICSAKEETVAILEKHAFVEEVWLLIIFVILVIHLQCHVLGVIFSLTKINSFAWTWEKISPS